MENVVLPCMSRPPAPVLSKQDIPFEFFTKPIKVTFSLTKTPHPIFPKITEADLKDVFQNGRLNEAVTAFTAFSKQPGSKLKANTFSHLLDCCINSNSIQLGRELHARIHLVDDVEAFVETKLVSMYAKCGSLVEARKVFDGMLAKNLYAWSAMIGAYSRERKWSEILELFGLMMLENTIPDDFLFPKIIQACGNCENFETGRIIHSLVIRHGINTCGRVSNALLTFYVKCGRWSSAERLFEKMDVRNMVTWNSMISGYCQRGENDKAHWLFDMMREEGFEPGVVTWNILIAGYNQCGNCDAAMGLMKKMESFGVTPDVFTWTSMISGFTQRNRIDQALELFREMLLAGVEPNGVTITSVLSACASAKNLRTGKELHAVAVKNESIANLLVGNSLVDMYAKCGELEAAQKIFDAVPEKDVYTWNSMIGGYCQAGYCGRGYDLFMKMQDSDVQPSAVTWNIMISGYIQNGDEDQAMALFQQLGKGGIVKPDTSSWNSLISNYLQIGDKNKALWVFRQMQSRFVRPNLITLLTILPACGNLLAVNKVKEIHASALRRNLDYELPTANALIDSYAKSGIIEYSKAVFDLMPSKDIITWNSLIAGYVLHGCAADALDAFDQMKMEGHKPNRGTFLSVLTAYGLTKKLDMGELAFASMVEDYRIVPGLEHYAAMVNLYGCSGKLGAAIEFIDRMVTEPGSAVWDALLTAARAHGNLALVIHACEHLLELNPRNNMTHNIISQAYELCRISVDALKERKSQRFGTNVVCGHSFVEIRNAVHSFVTGDHSRVGLSSLYSWLKSKAGNIKPSDANDVHCIEEEENEEHCGIHSEKLALAFSFVSNSSSIQPIRIMKNFRVCRDCHNTAKVLSGLYSRDIFLSDTKSLHHFKNGYCSCGDYW